MQSNQPAFFKQGPKPLTQLLIFAVLSLILVVGDTRYRMLGYVRSQLSIALYPLQWLATEPANLMHQGRDFITIQSQLLSENRRLKQAQLQSSTLLHQVRELTAENQRLRELAETHRTLPQAGQVVEILYTARDPFAARLVIDRGSAGGINDGQVVIDSVGVVGQVARVQPLTSEVRLLSDRNQMVPVVVARNQLRTVVYGMGQYQPLEVRNLAPNVDIQMGDILLTSGLDGIYPAGLPVAKVSKVERQAGTAFARIFCTPIAAIDQHRFLLVLGSAKPMPEYPAEASAPQQLGVKPRRGR